ncbi:MAG: hypothetical protein ABMB14_33825, partial [Myxococcota bacterium]
VVTHGLVAAIRGVDPADRPAFAAWWTAAGLGGTAIVVATWMRGHYGGFMNVLMPAHWALCAGLGWIAVDLGRRFPGIGPRLAVAALLAGQGWWIGAQLEVRDVVPTAEDVAAGDEVVARLVQCPDGPILSPYAAWLPVQAGRAPSPHLIAMWDIDHPTGPFRDGVDRLKDASRAHRWPCVVHGGRQALGYGVDANYQVATRFEGTGRAMMPKTGWRVRPQAVLVPKTP